MTAPVSTCATCGATSTPPVTTGEHDEGSDSRAPGAGPSSMPPPGWTTSVDHGRAVVVCPVCTRRHVRAIEARLDVEWW